MSLEQLLQQRPDLWRGREMASATPPGVSSGFAELDRSLSWRGWPPGALVEILSDGAGTGTFSLVVPALAALSREGRWLLLINPPYLPYAPALAWQGVDLARLLVLRPPQQADVAWAAELGLQSGACSTVLIWGGVWETGTLRRLQLAAEAGGAVAWQFRDTRAAARPTPAALRLQVAPGPAGVTIQVLKQRGGWPGPPVELCLWEQDDLQPLLQRRLPRLGPEPTPADA